MSSQGIESKRVVLSLEGEKVNKINPKNSDNDKYQCYPNRAYLIVGEKNTLIVLCYHSNWDLVVHFIGSEYSTWLDLTEWLLLRNARKIVVAIKNYAMSTTVSRRYLLTYSEYFFNWHISYTMRPGRKGEVAGRGNMKINLMFKTFKARGGINFIISEAMSYFIFFLS